MITVSTDGSCLVNPGGAMGWAWINHDGSFDSGGAASGTNQIAELTAILQALRAHPSSEPLLIESDSQYAIKCASEWLPGWKLKGWRTASGTPVRNVELIQAIDAAISDRPGPVRFRWVRGHIGNEFNERADQLAGIAAQDWAAGRGDLEEALIPALPRSASVSAAPLSASGAASTTAAASVARSASGTLPAPEVADVIVTSTSEWHMDALFD